MRIVSIPGFFLPIMRDAGRQDNPTTCMSLDALPICVTSSVMMFAHPTHPCKHEIENVFVRYLEVCALEKRGPHTLSDTHDATERRAMPADIELITRYAKNAIADARHRDSTQATQLLRSVADSAATSNTHVHLTRDYQVIETGNHYVKLVFCVATADGHVDRIKFAACFGVDCDYATHNLRRLSVCYARDSRHLLGVDVGPRSRLIMNLPTKHLMDVDYVPTVDCSVDACTIC